MAIPVVATQNLMATYYGTIATYGALSTTVPGASAGTEVTGGTYARIACAWGSASAGTVTATAQVFNVPAGTTVVGYMNYNASTAGTYINGTSITSQTFSSAGTYTVTPSFNEA
jgi:hypothetical protein